MKTMKFVDGVKEISEGMTVVLTNGASGRFRMREAIVEKVGRELATIGGTRFYLETGKEQTEYTSGAVYSSIAAYNDYTVKMKLISSVKSHIYKIDFTMSYEQAQEIAKILNIKVEE